MGEEKKLRFSDRISVTGHLVAWDGVGGERGYQGRGHMCTCRRFNAFCSRETHSITKLLYSNKIKRPSWSAQH